MSEGRKQGVQVTLGRSAQSLRWCVSTGLLLILVFVTPFLNWGATAVWVNTQIALMQMLFVISLLPEVKLRIVAMLNDSPAFRLTVGFAVVASLGSALVNPSVVQESRLWLYWVQLLFFVAAVVWFTAEGGRGMTLVAFSKLFSMLLVCVFFLCAMYVYEASRWKDMELPVYRNIRHLNYDLATAVICTVLLWVMVRAGSLVSRIFFILAALFGFICLFTEGRGQLLSTLLFFLMSFWGVARAHGKKVLSQAVMGFVLGAVLLLWMYPDTLNSLLSRTLVETPDRVSAGRFTMWAQASTAWLGGSIWQVVFGLGPDSFRTLQLSPGYVHPHNSMIQAVMEFGLVGLCLLLYFAWQVLRCASRALKGDNNLVPGLIAAGLLSMGCYSLLDGIFYHGGPFLVCVLMGAYLFVFSESYMTNATCALQ